MSTRRMARVNELIRTELAHLIARELKTPLPPGVVSITEVDTSADLHYAQVYISILGEEGAKQEAFAALQRAKGFLRHGLAERLSLRHTPELVLHLDESLQRGAHILELLRDVGQESSSAEKER